MASKDSKNVDVVITFAADDKRQGKTESHPAEVARALVREGGARFATPAQEKKATPGA